MTVHYFTCDDCGITIQDHTTKEIHRCYKCGRDMRWDLNIAIHGNYKHSVHSDALAISPSQRAEHERLFPDIELDKQCRPVFNNFTKHEKYLKATGFRKEPQKIRRAGAKTIAKLKN